MSDEEMNKKMEFIVEHQARFAAEIEMMCEVQAADSNRLGNGLIGVMDIVGRLAQLQMRTDETVNSLTQDFSRLTQAQTRTEERFEQLAQSQKRTDERLNIFVNVVERFISGDRGAESSA